MKKCVKMSGEGSRIDFLMILINEIDEMINIKGG